MMRLRQDLLPLALLIGLPLILFWQVTVGGRTLIPADNLTAFEPWRTAGAEWGVTTPHNQLLSDLVLENYLWKKFTLESIGQGELPVWNPYQFSGVPFLAAGQHSALYPFSALYYLLPLPAAYGWFTVTQFWLAGLLAYAYLRLIGLRRLSALFGGIVYQLSLFMVVSVVFQMIIAAAAWLPLILLCLECIARRQPVIGGRPASLPWMALGAAALAFQITAGHVEVTYYTLLIAGAYSVWRLAAIARAGSAPGRWARLARPAGAMLGLAAFGLALGAIQFVPLFELAEASFRTGRSTYAEVVGWAFPLRHVLLFLIPNFYGNPSHHGYFDLFTGRWTAATLNARGEAIDTIDWGVKNYVEGGTYLGLLTLLLIVIAAAGWIRQWRARRASADRTGPAFVPFFSGLALVSLAFAFGTPLYALIYWLPGISQLHSPFRWVWPLSLAAAVLAAQGVDTLLAEEKPQATRRPGPLTRLLSLGGPLSLTTILAGLAVWGGVGVLLGLAAARWQFASLEPLMDQLVHDLALAETAFADGRMFFSYTAGWVALFAALLAASGLALRLAASPAAWRGRPLWHYAIIVVIAVDLLAAGWGFNPSADPQWLADVPPSAAFLKQDTGLWRFTTYDPHGQKPYNANTGWLFNFYDVRGYDSLFTRQYADYMGLIEPQDELDFNRIAPLRRAEALDSPLLHLLNVKYVISLAPIDNPRYTPVYDAEVKIYRNEAVMPRAWLLPQTATLAVDDLRAAVQQFDPRYFVMVEPGDALGVEFALPAQPAPADEIRYSPGEVFVSARANEPAWLILADTYDPGWKAFVRPRGAGDDLEQERPIARVAGNFRGVGLPAGEWTVRFKYTPVSLRLGFTLSVAAGLGLLFVLGIWAWRQFYPVQAAEDSTARRVAKNSIMPTLLNLMNRGIDLVFAAFYLRVLGPEDVGKFYLAIVIFGWFEIITNYGLNTLLTRDASRDRARANRHLVNTTILRLILAVAAVPALIALLGLRQALPSPLTEDTLWAIGLLVVAQVPATISTGLTALFYVFEKAEYPAAVATIATLIKVTLGVAALMLGYGFVGMAGVSIIVNLVTLAILAALVWRMFFRPRWELDWGLQRGAVRESFPLMLNHLLATLFFKVDVPLLETIRNQQQAGLGNREVGWYRTAYQFVDAFNVIPSFFTFALFPVMSRQAAEDREALRRSYALAVKLLVAVALPTAVLTTYLAETLIGVLGGPDYLPFGAIALAVMIWSIPFGWINSVTNYVLVALGQARDLTRAFALALAFNIVLNLIFLPRYGFVAAAAITIASEVFEGAWFYWYLRRSLGPLPWARWLWRLWAAAGIMLIGLAVAGLAHPALGVAASAAIYLIALAGLRAFEPDERRVLTSILPAGLQRRLASLTPGRPRSEAD